MSTEKTSELLEKSAQTIRAQQEKIGKLEKAAGNLADQVLALQLEKQAVEFSIELAKKGHIGVEDIPSHAEEMAKKGERGLEIAREGLKYSEKGASFGIVGSEENVEPTTDDEDVNELYDYLAEHAASCE